MSLCIADIIYFTILLINVKSEWVENNGLWYYISRYENADYDQAGALCESMQSRLAVITDDHQNDFLRTHTDDGIDRWIGLSNTKTNQYTNACNESSWVWNNDWFCEIEYGVFEIDDMFPSFMCQAMYVNAGQFQAVRCDQEHGFICQWECKRFYLYLKSRPDYSGLYIFDHYYNRNIVFTKKDDENEIFEIFVSTHFDQWVVTRYRYEEDDYHYEAFYYTRSYVPYGARLSWRNHRWGNFEWGLIKSMSVCLECDTIHVRRNVSNINPEFHGIFHLELHNFVVPLYTNKDNTIQIRHHDFEEYCICSASEDNGCDNRCGYIFPYPKQTSTITLNNREKWIFTNMCFQTDYTTSASIPTNHGEATTSESVQKTYGYSDRHSITDAVTSDLSQIFTDTVNTKSSSKIVQTVDNNAAVKRDSTGSPIFSTISVSPAHIQYSRDDNVILIVAIVPISTIILIVIIVVPIVIKIGRRRNKNDDTNTNKSEAVRSGSNRTEANIDYALNDVYTEFDGHGSSFNHISQATTDVAPPSNWQPIDDRCTHTDIASANEIRDNLGTPRSQTQRAEFDMNTEYRKEQRADGYLAPDYGVLMDTISKQSNAASNKSYPRNIPLYSEVNKKQVCNSNEISKDNTHLRNDGNITTTTPESDYDLQLHENELYKSNTEDEEIMNGNNTNIYYNDPTELAEVDVSTSHANVGEQDNVYYNVGECRPDTTEAVDDDDLEIFDNSVYDHTQ